MEQKSQDHGSKPTNRRNPILKIIFWASAFLIFSGVVIAIVIYAAGRSVPDRSILEIDLSTPVVERKTRTLYDSILSPGESEIVFFDLVEAIERAATDPKVIGINLSADGYSGGWATSREISSALNRFRAKGKKVAVYSDGLDQKQFLIASSSDFLALNPSGGVLIEGLSRFRQYYGSALRNTAGVDVHLFKAGQFKSAAEPYILDAASKESKLADLFWMSDLWDRYLFDVSKNRKLTKSVFRDDINGFAGSVVKSGGSLSKTASALGWVDFLMDREEFEKGASGLKKIFGQSGELISLDDYIESKPTTQARIAIVVGQGEIGADPDGIVGEEMVNEIDQAVEDGYEAIVIRIDSPGGGVFPSEQIRSAILRAKAKKVPVIASMSDIAASGGYMIAMDADRIFADDSTITGSIGVFGLIPNLNRALSRFGVFTDGAGTTTLSGASNVTAKMPPDLPVVIQAVIDGTYDRFITDAAAGRRLKKSKVHSVAQGRVWSGAQARREGLVDEAGGLLAAVRYAGSLIEKDRTVPKAEIVNSVQEQPFSVMQLFSKIKTGAVSSFLGEPAAKIVAAAASTPAKNQPGLPFQVLTNCFCGED